jgi:glycolate oxidase FAD binding subunit
MNLPHFFAGQFGSWRDWVLGMTVVVADGTIVKTGSKVVKSVAGYDLHKLFIGARGTLGVIVDVTLRTHPLKAIASLQNGLPKANFTGNCDWIQRTNRTDFDPTRAGEAYADSESSTLWTKLAPSETLHRFPGDWVLRSNSGNDNIQVLNPAERSLMLRLKQKLDPTSKLNPGEFGFL